MHRNDHDVVRGERPHQRVELHVPRHGDERCGKRSDLGNLKRNHPVSGARSSNIGSRRKGKRPGHGVLDPSSAERRISDRELHGHLQPWGTHVLLFGFHS